ncbi:MAG: factor-independent urate hydroxylase [Thermomicrobiales bacterium]
MSTYDYEIGYGKHRIPVYRMHARPLEGLRAIPESPFVGRSNIVFAVEVDVEVLGSRFLPAYTHGDNRLVVATDSMKNFVLRETLAYDGATHEGLLTFLGDGFLRRYEQMEALRLTCRELPFIAAPAPGADAGSFSPSEVLFDRGHDDYTIATLEMTRDGIEPVVAGHRCGRLGLQLMKTTGSAFTSFVRDGYTTLPERRDRPLFIYLDLFWRYGDLSDMLGDDPSRYVPAEQVRDLARTVFHEFVSESIQHLVHEIGQRALDRFPQLAEISFDAENRTRDPFSESETDPRVKVYSDPFPAYGGITLTMRRSR